VTAPVTALATMPVVRALIDEARNKDYPSGALGIHARPEWTGPRSFEHHGMPVTVVPCVSSLAVREALRDRDARGWTVVITDRDNADLGAGIRGHLIGHRLRTPDPWSAVSLKFQASGLDPSLTTVPGSRELAAGLLAATPVEDSWPPAPGGVLTRDHALHAVAQTHLRVPRGEITADKVLQWTLEPTTPSSLAELRTISDALTDAVVDWFAGQLGAPGPRVARLVRSGRQRDVVPTGLVLDLLLRDDAVAADANVTRESLIRLEPMIGASDDGRPALRAWAELTAALVRDMLTRPAERAAALAALQAADALAAEVKATSASSRSDVLPSALDARLSVLAFALLQSAESPVDPARLLAVESAWEDVTRHALAHEDRRVVVFRAAVRLTRWLSLPDGGGDDLPALHRRHLDSDAWVDSAFNDAASGVASAEHSAAVAAVLQLVRRRRTTHDVGYAEALAAATRQDAPGTSEAVLVEELLAARVLPLAREAKVLLVVLDGMSAGVGLEVAEDLARRTSEGWVEHLPTGHSRRLGAVAVLPTLTEHSRTSLLAGRLESGQQATEQREYTKLCKAHGISGAVLFHKKPIESSRSGYALADDVASAIDDTATTALVTCVLNTIDDALDRQDPGGIEWTVDAVKHLAPLVDRARLAGRVVVLTSDHGHVVERRQGWVSPGHDFSSNRSRATGDPVGEGEVLVSGRRVLAHDGAAVLAVDEGLRYSAMKAGYHGGAAPAEVVIPVYFFVSGPVPAGADLVPAPPQEPAWWSDRVPVAVPTQVAPPPAPPSPPRTKRVVSDAPTLFDVTEAEPQPAPAASGSLAHATIASATYTEQRARALRVSVTDDQVIALLQEMLLRSDHRVPPTAAAIALGVPPSNLRGATLQVQRLLNVEGYPVLSFDADGSTVVLDEVLLREQFGLGS
jgi:hypothetical protein